MKHMMIDIETLDTATTAVVTQVGWCIFDRESVDSPVEMALDIDEQLRKGRTVRADTLKWWMQQPDIARQKVFDPEDVYTTAYLTTRLKMILSNGTIECVWSHGPAFDIATLKSLLGVEPWDFRTLRDTRTLAMLAPSAHKPAPLTKHSAGDDAHAQAQWVQNMWRELGDNLDDEYRRGIGL